MCNENTDPQADELVENEKRWITLMKAITEADKIYVKIFGIYVRIEKPYHNDLILGFGAGIPRQIRNTCPSFDYAGDVLYITNVW